MIKLKQKLPFKYKLVFMFPLLAFALVFIKQESLYFILFLIPTALIFGLNYTLVINKNFNNYYLIKCFNFGIFKSKKELIYPDYISVFKQNFRQSNQIGFMPDVVGDSKFSEYVIRFFKDNKHVTVFFSNDKENTITLGNKLSDILDVNLHNAID